MNSQEIAKHDEIIIKHIQDTPNNLQYAFRQVAQVLNRPVSTIQGRYKILKNKTPIHCLSSPTGFVTNIKNTPAPEEEKMIMTVIKKHIHKLNKQQKLLIIDLLLN